VNSIANDIRFGVRMLWKHRLASVVCIIALGLGMGATAAIFSMAEAFLLHPIPIPDVSRIVALVDTRPQDNVLMNSVAPATYLEWQQQATSFEETGAYRWDQVNLTGDGTPQRIIGFDVTSNFFALLGVHPALGRGFLPEEDAPGKNQVLIVSYGLWQRRYASDPAILGKYVRVDGKSFTIVGVMGKGFNFPAASEAWMPMSLTDKEKFDRESRYMWIFGRLKPGVTVSKAAAEMATLTQRQAREFPDVYKGWQLHVMPLREYAAGNLTPQYTVLLLCAVLFVLLIACADVANVQFARVTGRQKELAVRTALGAGRLRIVRQLLIESVLLSCCGAAFGLLFARWQLAVMMQHMPPEVARFVAGWYTIHLDAGAFAFTLGLAVLSGIISGIAPALLTSRANVGETLKESGRGSSAGRSRHRLRSALVVAEVALSVVLLVGAGLLVKGFHALLTVHGASHPETLLSLSLELPELKYQESAARLSFQERLLERLSAIPQVKSAALVTAVPYADGGGIDQQNISIEGRTPAEHEDSPAAIVETISPNYFALMNIGLRDGRVFASSDGESTQPVAVISASLATRYFPGLNPLGRKLKVGAVDNPNSWLTIAGIVDDVHYNWIDKNYLPTLYRLYRQSPRYATSVLLRTEGSPTSFLPAVRAEIAAIDPDLPIFDTKPLDQLITQSIIGFAYVAALMGGIGIIALVLASVGVYGVMSYSVSERTHEIGIRMAMGASGNQIQRLIIGNGMLLTVIGIVVGLPIALVMAFGLSSIIFGVSPNDPASFVGLPLLLASVALLASYIPARRVLRVDPLVALRYE
jgi:putative ABC transport system permease protein